MYYVHYLDLNSCLPEVFCDEQSSVLRNEVVAGLNGVIAFPLSHGERPHVAEHQPVTDLQVSHRVAEANLQ
jgi:hypothetical protein